MASLANLPADLRYHITSFLARKKDLRHVRQTCKALYAAAIPRLYRRVVIREKLSIEALAAMLNPENAGLQYVRHLEIVSKCGDYHRKKPAIDTSMTLLANLLPRDVLQTFTFDCSSFVGTGAMQILWDRQSHLRTLRSDGSVFANTLLVSFPATMPRITTIHLEICDSLSSMGGGDLLKCTPALLHLEVRLALRQYCSQMQHDYSKQSDRAKASDEVLRALFGDQTHNGTSVLKLRSLQLHDFDLLGPAALKLLQTVDCSRLQALGLQKCAHAIDLLRGIKPTGLPAHIDLKHLVITTTNRDDEDSEDDVIDDFLESFTGLEQLLIYAPSIKALWPSMFSIAEHGVTLRSLFLHCAWPGWPDEDEEDEDHYSVNDDLRSCMKQCIKLEELALQSPPLVIDDLPETIRLVHRDFAGALSAAPALRTLRLLNVLDVEDIDFDISADPPFTTWVTAMLRVHADEYFSHLSTLTAMTLIHGAIAPGSKFHLGDLQLETHYYGRIRTIDAYGKAGAMAVEMSKEDLQDIEPASAILECNPLDWRMLRYGYDS